MLPFMTFLYSFYRNNLQYFSSKSWPLLNTLSKEFHVRYGENSGNACGAIAQCELVHIEVCVSCSGVARKCDGHGGTVVGGIISLPVPFVSFFVRLSTVLRIFFCFVLQNT